MWSDQDLQNRQKTLFSMNQKWVTQTLKSAQKCLQKSSWKAEFCTHFYRAKSLFATTAIAIRWPSYGTLNFSNPEATSVFLSVYKCDLCCHIFPHGNVSKSLGTECTWENCHTFMNRVCCNDTAVLSISLPREHLLFALGIAVGTIQHHRHK